MKKDDIKNIDWSGNLDNLFLVVKNPETDYGIALMLFWHSGAPWKSYEQLGNSNKFREIVELLTENLLSNFYKTKLVPYNPVKECRLTRGQLIKYYWRKNPSVLIEATPAL